MEILEITPIFATKIIYPILCVVFLVLGLFCEAVCKPDESNMFSSIFCIICFVGFITFFALARAIQKPTGRNQYLVKIDEDYPLTEVIEQYDIVEVRNIDTGLYVLEDKKD